MVKAKQAQLDNHYTLRGPGYYLVKPDHDLVVANPKLVQKEIKTKDGEDLVLITSEGLEEMQYMMIFSCVCCADPEQFWYKKSPAMDDTTLYGLTNKLDEVLDDRIAFFKDDSFEGEGDATFVAYDFEDFNRDDPGWGPKLDESQRKLPASRRTKRGTSVLMRVHRESGMLRQQVIWNGSTEENVHWPSRLDLLLRVMP